MSTARQLQAGEPFKKLVTPARYAARGEVVQTTSTAITPSSVHLRAIRPPDAGLHIGLTLYLPGRPELFSHAVVGDVEPGNGFWAELVEEDAFAAETLTKVILHFPGGEARTFERFHTQLDVVVREPQRPVLMGIVTNLSRSGAYVRLDEALPALGSQVYLQLDLGDGLRTVGALVVHVVEKRGIGVQFIEGTDAFRSALDAYLLELEDERTGGRS